MLEPASFLVFRELIGTALHVIKRTPEAIAEEYGLYVERSFESGLGYYTFVGFQKGEYYFGLRRFVESPVKTNSMVSVMGAPDGMKKGLIAEALNMDVSEVIELKMEH
ncbi:MAG: hypothetical protein ABJN69_12610 [Hellea sp.]